MADPFNPNKKTPEDEFGDLSRALLIKLHPDKYPEDVYGAEIHNEVRSLLDELLEIDKDNGKGSARPNKTATEKLREIWALQPKIDIFERKVKLKEDENARSDAKKETFIPLAEFKTKFMAYVSNRPNFDSEGCSFYANDNSYDPANGTVKIKVVFNGSFEERTLGTVDEFDKLIRDVLVDKTKTLKEIFGNSDANAENGTNNEKEDEEKKELTKEQMEKIGSFQESAKRFQEKMKTFDWEGEGYIKSEKEEIMSDMTRKHLESLILDARAFRGFKSDDVKKMAEDIFTKIKK